MQQASAAGADDFTEAAEILDRAVNGLKEAGTLHHLPRGLAGAGGDVARGGELAELALLVNRKS